MNNPPINFTVLKADVDAFVQKVESGAKWFAGAATKVVAWVDAKFPGAQQALAVAIQDGEAAMADLATYAEQGFADVVQVAIDTAEQRIAERVQLSGLNLTTKQSLSAADVATVSAVSGIAQAAEKAALAKVLSTIAGVGAAALQAK